MKYARFKSLIVAASCYAVSIHCASSATVKATLQTQSSRSEAPPFSLTDEAGKTHKLADYRGKVLLLNFWATDCGGCRLEIPWLADIDTAYKAKGVAVIGISMDISYEDLKNASEAWAKVKPFVSAQHIRYPILMEDGQTTKRYNIQALPATYLIDRFGRIAATYVGLIDKQNVQTNLEALLAKGH